MNTGSENTVDTSYEGHCWVCGDFNRFVKNHRSIREGYRCTQCSSSLRYRGQAQTLIEYFGTRQTRSLEQLSSLSNFRELQIFEAGITGPFRQHFSNITGYQCSFFWNDTQTGTIRDGIQCQNLEYLTLESNSTDLVISSDVMEHVRKPWKAFEEIHRILKPGGIHVFSIPVQKPMRPTCKDRVDTTTDEDKFLLEPRYHGNGIGGKSLVYVDFGWDLLDKLSSMGYTASVHSPDDNSEDARKLVTFISRKNIAIQQ